MYGIAPLARIQATAADVSSPPEKAMPMRSPTGSDNTIRPLFIAATSRPEATAEAGHRDERSAGGDRQLDDRQAGHLGDVEDGDAGEHG